MKLMLLIGGIAFLLLGLVLLVAAIVVFLSARKRSAKAPAHPSVPATPAGVSPAAAPPSASAPGAIPRPPAAPQTTVPPVPPPPPAADVEPPRPHPAPPTMATLSSGEPTYIGESTIAIPIPGRQWGQLSGMSGSVAGRSFPVIAEGFYIGRDASASHVVIEDGSVSKRHVWVGVRDGEVIAIDEGSTNGTYVNTVGTRIHRQPLNPGDTLIISNDVARLVYQR